MRPTALRFDPGSDEPFFVGCDEEPAFAVLIAPLDESTQGSALLFARKLRRAGISCVTETRSGRLKKKIEMAVKARCYYLALLGSSEVAAGTITLKDLDAGSQDTLPEAEAVERLRQMLLTPAERQAANTRAAPAQFLDSDRLQQRANAMQGALEEIGGRLAIKSSLTETELQIIDVLNRVTPHLNLPESVTWPRKKYGVWVTPSEADAATCKATWATTSDGGDPLIWTRAEFTSPESASAFASMGYATGRAHWSYEVREILDDDEPPPKAAPEPRKTT